MYRNIHIKHQILGAKRRKGDADADGEGMVTAVK
jgi:hypothetical protein